MELSEIDQKSKKMLANFLNEIGLNGDYFVEINNTPIEWGKGMHELCGKYYSPESSDLQKSMER